MPPQFIGLDVVGATPALNRGNAKAISTSGMGQSRHMQRMPKIYRCLRPRKRPSADKPRCVVKRRGARGQAFSPRRQTYQLTSTLATARDAGRALAALGRAARAGQAEGCRGDGLAKTLISEPVAISLGCFFGQKLECCASFSSFDVLRIRWHWRMFSSRTKWCNSSLVSRSEGRVKQLVGTASRSFRSRHPDPKTSVSLFRLRFSSDAQHLGPPRLPSQTIHARSDRSGRMNGQKTQAWTETAQDPFRIGSES
jgi:hypothetical protein